MSNDVMKRFEKATKESKNYFIHRDELHEILKNTIVKNTFWCSIVSTEYFLRCIVVKYHNMDYYIILVGTLRDIKEFYGEMKVSAPDTAGYMLIKVYTEEHFHCVFNHSTSLPIDDCEFDYLAPPLSDSEFVYYTYLLHNRGSSRVKVPYFNTIDLDIDLVKETADKINTDTNWWSDIDSDNFLVVLYSIRIINDYLNLFGAQGKLQPIEITIIRSNLLLVLNQVTSYFTKQGDVSDALLVMENFKNTISQFDSVVKETIMDLVTNIIAILKQSNAKKGSEKKADEC